MTPPLRPLAITSALSLLSACDDNAAGPLVLDSSPNCASVEMEVIASDLAVAMAWTRVRAAAHEAPRSDDYWLLVEAPDETGESALAVAHVRQGGETVGAWVGETRTNATLELRPGTRAGEVWLVEQADGWTRLARFRREGSGITLRRTGNLGGFPHADDRCTDDFGNNIGCDVSDWPRLLGFLDGRAYIISIPPFSPDTTTDLWLGRLDDALRLVEERQLDFAPLCDPSLPAELYEECQQGISSGGIGEIRLVARQRSSAHDDFSMLLLRTKDPADIIPMQDIVIATLGLDGQDAPVGTLRSQRDVSNTVFSIESDEAASTLVVDDFGFYWMTRSEIATFVLGYSALSALFAPLLGFDSTEPKLELLQLADDVAVGWVANGQWQVLKLFPPAPQLSGQSTYQPDSPVRRVLPAGDGVFLVERESDGPDLVRLRCDADDEAAASAR